MTSIEKIGLQDAGKISAIADILKNLDTEKVRKAKAVLSQNTQANIPGDLYVPEALPHTANLKLIQTLRGYTNGWQSLNPFLNARAKVFTDQKKYKLPTWILVWTKDESVFNRGTPVPKKSLIYTHIISSDENKLKTLEACEEILLSAFFQAKNFIAKNKDVQPGFEIVGNKNSIMVVRGVFGIELSYEYADSILKALREKNWDNVVKLHNFLKASFVHEMAHELRNEVYAEGDEIASHVTEILACGGDNPLTDEKITGWLDNKSIPYNQDILAALKIVKKLLSGCKDCTYKPESFYPDELNKAMKSIPEDIREKLLSSFAKSIIRKKSLDLLKIAAGVNNMPEKKLKKLAQLLRIVLKLNFQVKRVITLWI